MLRLARLARLSSTFALLGLASACGGSPPPAPVVPAGPAKAAPVADPGPDLSPAAEPDGLLVLGRVNKPESIVAAVGIWTHLPLPGGRMLVSSISDDAVADVVDLNQPIDAAVSLNKGAGDMKPLAAYAIAVTSFEDAKTKLGARHRLSPGPNGQLKVDGLGALAGGGGSRKRHSRARPKGEEETDGNEEEGCVLAPAAPSGARLVCGDAAAIEALAPYLTRTMPRQKWSSDLHVELRPAPLRKPLAEVRAGLPLLARGLMGTKSQAIHNLLDASMGEGADFVQDLKDVTIDAQVADSGVVATTRIVCQSQKSVLARIMTSDSNKAGLPPPALWHLPGDTDLAFFQGGSDPKLFAHPRQLLVDVLRDVVEEGGMPEAERKALSDLVGGRTFDVFSGAGIYAKGYDSAALAKAIDARSKLKPDDYAGEAEAKRVIFEQAVGWHLYQVTAPIAKVGPVLKDWSALWNRPTFAAWAKSKASAKTMMRIRIAPPVAGVTLPKESVHLEITIPREDLADPTLLPQPPGAVNPASMKHAKPVPRKPVVIHVIAVPDGGATWFAFGLDAKLISQKAAASLAQAPETGTLGKAATLESLRDGKMNGAAFMSLRSVLGFTALDRRASSFSLLESLPNKGNSPLVLAMQAEPASGGQTSAVSTFRVPRGTIEDAVKLLMSH